MQPFLRFAQFESASSMDLPCRFFAGLAFETEGQYTLARIAVLAASALAAAIGAGTLAAGRRKQS